MTTTTTHFEDLPLADLVNAADATAKSLQLKHRPVVVRDEATAFGLADRTKCDVVMLGKGAYWAVCMADAARLERAGYEWAPRA